MLKRSTGSCCGIFVAFLIFQVFVSLFPLPHMSRLSRSISRSARSFPPDVRQTCLQLPFLAFSASATILFDTDFHPPTSVTERTYKDTSTRSRPLWRHLLILLCARLLAKRRALLLTAALSRFHLQAPPQRDRKRRTDKSKSMKETPAR